MKQKRVLITGIAGFIGMHLALALQKRGDLVIGCDSFTPYYDLSLKQQRVELLKKEGIDVISCDICDRTAMEKLLDSHRTTHLVHLAAQAGVRYALKDPMSYVHSNLSGFVHLLELLRERKHIALTFASSSSVYGKNVKIPFSEEDPTDNPANFYGATKKSDEIIAKSYHNTFGIRSTGLRFFTVYGPWGRPDMIYYAFTDAILKGRPIPVFGDGLLKRDYTFIEDIIAGTMAAIDLEAECEIFNLGNHQPHTILELIALLEKGLGSKATLNFLPVPPGEVVTTFADISKAKRLLNYFPKTSLETGIERFVEWYRFKKST